MALIHVTKDNFEQTVASGTVLLDFYADWCGPCQMVAPVLAEIADQNPTVTVGKINVDEESELAAKFGVVSIPTLVVLKNGEIKNTAVGFREKKDILKMI